MNHASIDGNTGEIYDKSTPDTQWIDAILDNVTDMSERAMPKEYAKQQILAHLQSTYDMAVKKTQLEDRYAFDKELAEQVRLGKVEELESIGLGTLNGKPEILSNVNGLITTKANRIKTLTESVK